MQNLTNKPFGVNLTFLPSLDPPDYAGLVDVIIKEDVKVVETAGNNPKSGYQSCKTTILKSFINAHLFGMH